MASNLKAIIIENANTIEQATGTDKAMAILALTTFLLNRGLAVMFDIRARGELDDQGALDLAKKHDAEAKEAWAKLKAETEP